MGLGRLKKRLDKFKKAADIDVVLAEIVSDKDLQKFAIELNTRGQLFDKGIDSFGVSLGEYAGTTIEGVEGKFLGKKKKGQPFDRITLLDEGKFHASFVIETGGRAFLMKIIANPKRGDTDLFKDFGKAIVGWTEQNLQLIIDEIRSKIVPLIKKRMAA